MPEQSCLRKTPTTWMQIDTFRILPMPALWGLKWDEWVVISVSFLTDFQKDNIQKGKVTVCPKHLEVQHRQMCWLPSLATSPLDAFRVSLYQNLEETISLIICWLSEMQLSLFIKDHYQVCHTSYKMSYKMQVNLTFWYCLKNICFLENITNMVTL